jgi:TatD DNase family protein
MAKNNEVPGPKRPGSGEGQSAPVPLTDTHAHLGHIEERLGGERLERLFEPYRAAWAAAEAGQASTDSLPFILDIGTRPGDLSARQSRFGALPFIGFSAGLWPGGEAFADPGASLELLEADISNASCRALGECGLDYFHMEADRGRQLALFEAQAALAQAKGLPLIVHSRDAFEDSLAVVSAMGGGIPVVIHCFSYGPEEAEAFLASGCLLSFAGNLTYHKAQPLMEALRIAAREKAFLLETDSPYMNPMPRRGRASTPLDIGRTYAFAASVLGVGLQELVKEVQERSFRIFGPGRRVAGIRG